jgi:hypothetical protein
LNCGAATDSSFAFKSRNTQLASQRREALGQGGLFVGIISRFEPRLIGKEMAPAGRGGWGHSGSRVSRLGDNYGTSVEICPSTDTQQSRSERRAGSFCPSGLPCLVGLEAMRNVCPPIPQSTLDRRRRSAFAFDVRQWKESLTLMTAKLKRPMAHINARAVDLEIGIPGHRHRKEAKTLATCLICVCLDKADCCPSQQRPCVYGAPAADHRFGKRGWFRQ